MSRKRRLQGLLGRPVLRRALSLTVLIVLAAAGIVLGPALAVVAYLLDRVRGDEQRRRTRLLGLFVGAVLVELTGVLIALTLWIVTGFGFFGNRRWVWHRHRLLMGWYTSAMLTVIVRVLGTRIEWRNGADLSKGPIVFAARHASFFDALIPSTVLSRRNRLLGHHVLTHGLSLSPCIDIVGHRFPNQFIDRAPSESSSSLPAIRVLGSLLDEHSAAVIFPEATFRTPLRYARAIRRLERRSPELLATAQELRHLLPPRPSGTHALLTGAPEADLVVCVHTGLEKFGSIKAILRSPTASDPVVVETWRIPRAEIPTDFDEFSDWLFSEFARMDRWIEAQR